MIIGREEGAALCKKILQWKNCLNKAKHLLYTMVAHFQNYVPTKK